MKKDKVVVYFLEFILFCVLAFALFVPNFNRIILACGMAIATVVINIGLKKRNIISINKSTVKIIFVILSIIYLGAFYLMGLYFGYCNAAVKFDKWAIIHYIVPIAVIIISSEIIRNIFVAQNTKFTKIITFIIMVLIDLVIYVDVYGMDDLEEIIEVVGYIVFASISSNLLYNYVSSRYGTVPIIIYRLITVLYVYIIPIIPDVHMFLRSILRTLYPYLIYLILEFNYPTSKKVAAYNEKTKTITSKILLTILVGGIALLISCEFEYGLLVVGSGSMTGTIDKYDAMIYEEFDGEEPIYVGQIVIFKKDNMKVVHRIIEHKNVNGQDRYITKGDSNPQIDEGYITKNDIVGLYKFKIKYLGYPSISLSELFAD